MGFRIPVMQCRRAKHTQIPCQAHTEKKSYLLLPNSELTFTDRSRKHHPGTEQASVLCILPIAHYHLHCFRGIGWMLRCLEVKSCIRGRKKIPSKPLQTAPQFLKAYSLENLVLKQMGQLFMLSFPTPQQITIDSIQKDRKQFSSHKETVQPFCLAY